MRSDVPAWMSYAISSLQLSNIILIGMFRKWGWVCGATSQSLLAVYGLWTQEWGYTLSAAVVGMYAVYFWYWRHETWGRVRPPRAGCRCKCACAERDSERVGVR